MENDAKSQNLISRGDCALGRAVSPSGEFSHGGANSATTLITAEVCNCVLKKIARAARAATLPGLIHAGCSHHTAGSVNRRSLHWP
jgi:hypothetical protein